MPDTIPVCSKCGIIKRSGKSSCCSRGGSWFGKCGSAGDSNHEHTWSEGILACNGWAGSKAAFGRQSNADQNFDLPDNVGLSNFNIDIAAAEALKFTSSKTPANTTANVPNNMSITILDTSSLPTTTNASTTAALATLAVNEATLVTDWVSQGMHVAP